MFALRWAVDQFNKESVLFRESERFDLGAWFRHLLRDRQDTPPAVTAVMCGLIILLLQFVLSGALQGRQIDLLVGAVIGQIVAILTPALMMTVMLTRSPAKTLLLAPPIKWSALPAAALLAVVLHPAVFAFGQLVRWMYPLPPGVEDYLEQLDFGGQSMSAVFLVIAFVAPVCEEIAFRGFILSGLRHLGRKRMAILISSLFFGLAHGILQQSISAAVFGMVIGYIAVQSGSLFVAITYHVVHNGLTLLAANALTEAPEGSIWRDMIGSERPNGWLYQWPAVAASCVAGMALLLWFRKLPYQKTEEERIQEALDREATHAAAV
jgi:sodium transport system permease protein